MLNNNRCGPCGPAFIKSQSDPARNEPLIIDGVCNFSFDFSNAVGDNLVKTMRPARALWAYLLLIFLGGALIAPWVYHFVPGLERVPFRRVVDRCLLILALLGLYPFLKALGFTSFAEIGWKRHPRMWSDLARGLLIGTVLLATAACVSIVAGAAVFDSSRNAARWAKQIPSAMMTGIVVALLEETLFRGAIFSALKRTWSEHGGLWVSSGLYAILHFFARPENPSTVEWNSGLVVLGRMLAGFADFQTVVPGFLSLTLLGIIFVRAYQQTEALYLSMGIHAGLVFWVKLFGFGTNIAPQANVWFWGTEKIYDGWFCFLLITAASIWFWRKR